MHFAPKAQKGIDKGKKSTRFFGTMYSRLEIQVGFKIDRKQKLNPRAVHQLFHTL